MDRLIDPERKPALLEQVRKEADLEMGRASQTPEYRKTTATRSSVQPEPIAPPLKWGQRVVKDMPLEIVLKHLSLNELYRLSWGAKNTHGAEWDKLKSEFNVRLEKMTKGALAFVDSDRFKDWNDSFGHAAGDRRCGSSRDLRDGGRSRRRRRAQRRRRVLRPLHGPGERRCDPPRGGAPRRGRRACVRARARRAHAASPDHRQHRPCSVSGGCRLGRRAARTGRRRHVSQQAGRAQPCFVLRPRRVAPRSPCERSAPARIEDDGERGERVARVLLLRCAQTRRVGCDDAALAVENDVLVALEHVAEFRSVRDAQPPRRHTPA